MAEIDWASPKTGDETDWASPKAEAAPARADVMGAPAAALTGLAHGISSGTGWLSRTAKRALLQPGELEELEQGYQGAKAESPKTAAVSDFIGSMYTPENAAAGQVLGAGLGVAGKTIKALAARKAGAAVGEAAAKKAAEKAAEIASKVGQIGGEAQKSNRLTEWLIRVLDEEKSGALAPADRVALEQLRKGPEYANTLHAASQRILTELPGQTAKVAGLQAELASLKAGAPQAISEATDKAVSGREALHQIGARVLRYGLPAAGAMVGHQLFGEASPLAASGIGALAGAGMRPMLHSLIRMRNNPAVRNQIWGAIEKVAGAGSGPTATGTAGRVISSELLPEMGARFAPAAADTESAAAAPAEPGSGSSTSTYRDATPLDAFRRVITKSGSHPAMQGANQGDR